MDSKICKVAREWASVSQPAELDLLRTLAQIPSPSHHEERRAAFVADWLRRAGADDVEIDELNNVICHINDDGRRPLLVFAAHIDVAFDDTDFLPLTEDENGRIHCPGIGDDTANLCNLLFATRYVIEHEVDFGEVGVLVVANSCEEGLGNLDGTKHLFATYGERIRAFRSFDGYVGQCTNDAVGSHRFQISCETPGGHSFVDFGSRNAVKELCDLIEDLYAIEPPAEPKTTYNVGAIEGGTTVNSIPAHAQMLFEFRSSSNSSLLGLREKLDALVAVHQSEEVRFEVEVLGVRPGNGDVDEGKLAELTAMNDEAIREMLGVEPDHSPFSTDSNVPLSLGIPANTIGTIHGENPHTYDEWLDSASLEAGLALVTALMLSCAAGA